MKLVFFFLTTSTLFTASAIPMMLSFGSPSAPSPLGPNHIPKVDFGRRTISKIDKAAATDVIINHYKGLESGNDHKEARLAFAKKGWRDGKWAHDEYRQYLDFDYHRGDTPDSAKIGQPVTISRDRPPPEAHFSHAISKESKPEIAKEMEKNFKALPPDQAKLVRSMKANKGWGDGPGFREEAQFTFHNGIIPTPKNTLWGPDKIYRPMSFLMDDTVSKDEIPDIKKRVREEHGKLDENHPFKQANYGVVTKGWHEDTESGNWQVGTTLYKVKDKLSNDAEENFKRIGDFHVGLGKDTKSEASGSSAGSAT